MAKEEVSPCGVEDETAKHSPDGDEDSDVDSDLSEEIKQQYARFCQEMEETEGFGVTFRPNIAFAGGVYPLNPTDHPDMIKRAERCARFAVDDHNKKQDKKLEFEKLVMQTAALCSGFLYYVTFEAKDSSGQMGTYQAKVHWRIDKSLNVVLFRTKP